MPRPAVGFDLDMTLIDSRPGIAAAWRELSRRTGVHVDAEAAISRLGPPLREEIRRWFPPEQVDEMVRVYRGLYPDFAVAPSTPMPGAAGALAAVRERGMRVVVVTAKLGRLARLHLEHLDLVPDVLAGDLFAGEKAAALAGHDARLYVGDHVADMLAARTAGIPAVRAATGPCSAAELRAAGAVDVLADLTGFPGALDRMVRLAL